MQIREITRNYPRLTSFAKKTGVALVCATAFCVAPKLMGNTYNEYDLGIFVSSMLGAAVGFLGKISWQSPGVAFVGTCLFGPLGGPLGFTLSAIYNKQRESKRIDHVA